MIKNYTLHRTEVGVEFTYLVLEAFRLHGALLAAGDDLVQEWDLTSARWKILGAIHNGASTVPDIARMMGVSRQGVQRIANELEKAGYIATAPNPAHKKANLHILTDYGAKVMELVDTKQALWANQVAAHFTEEELKVSAKVMARIRSLVLVSNEEDT